MQYHTVIYEFEPNLDKKSLVITKLIVIKHISHKNALFTSFTNKKVYLVLILNILSCVKAKQEKFGLVNAL